MASNGVILRLRVIFLKFTSSIANAILYIVFRFDNDTIPSITIEHIPGEELVVASFDWPAAQPIDIYAIDAAPHVSFELDAHFPVRPARVVLRDYTSGSSLSAIERLGGENLASAMQRAPFVGFSVMRLTLEDHHRLAIAQMQIGSPSTPDLLRRSCNGIARSLAPLVVQHA